MSDRSDWITLRPWKRHGLILMTGGAAYVVNGIDIWLRQNTVRLGVELSAITRTLNPTFWALSFVIGGLLVMISSRWPRHNDYWGYIILTSLASAWSGAYILGYLLGSAKIHNISLGALWGLLAFLWWVVGGLTDYYDYIHHDPSTTRWFGRFRRNQ